MLFRSVTALHEKEKARRLPQPAGVYDEILAAMERYEMLCSGALPSEIG